MRKAECKTGHCRVWPPTMEEGVEVAPARDGSSPYRVLSASASARWPPTPLLPAPWSLTSCWSLNCKGISSVLHLYPPLLMIYDFGGIIMHGRFHIFTVYIPLLVNLVICGIFVSCCGLFCLEKFL